MACTTMANPTIGIKNILSAMARQRWMNYLKNIVPQCYDDMESVIKASVLVPLCKVGDDPSLLYVVRTPHHNCIRGEVMFPGGNSYEGENPTRTALRQTYFLIGLSQEKIEILGKGNGVISPKNVLITPVISIIRDQLKKTDFTVNAREIIDVLTVPIELLCNTKNQYYTVSNNDTKPVFIVDKYRIWGTTALITHTFLSLILDNEVYDKEWYKNKIDTASQISSEPDTKNDTNP